MRFRRLVLNLIARYLNLNWDTTTNTSKEIGNPVLFTRSMPAKRNKAPLPKFRVVSKICMRYSLTRRDLSNQGLS